MSPRRRELLRLGKRGKLVRVVEARRRGAAVILVLFKNAAGKREERQFSKRERTDAIGFAEGIAREQATEAQLEAPKRFTLEEIWKRYSADIWPSLRPRSQLLYKYNWNLFANFAGPHRIAEDLTIDTMLGLRAALEAKGLQVNTIRQVMGMARMVYGWAETHELISRNRIGRYVYRVAKEQRPESPAEYRDEELAKILAELNPDHGNQWRAHVALTVCGRQGARQHSVLHLAWPDLDFEAGTITWRRQWDKTGQERVQPMRTDTRAALEVAKRWREKMGYTGPWVFPGYARKHTGNPYTITALWGVLKRAELRAGVPRLKQRGGHGLRRLLAGDVMALTGNVKDAADAIGDRDIKIVSERYLKHRQDRQVDTFHRLDEQAEGTRSSGQTTGNDSSEGETKNPPLPTTDRTGV